LMLVDFDGIFMDVLCIFLNGAVYEAFEMWFGGTMKNPAVIPWSRRPFCSIGSSRNLELKWQRQSLEVNIWNYPVERSDFPIKNGDFPLLYGITVYNLVGGLEHLDYISIYWECHHPN
jgi:hypothetical protein